MSDPEQTREQKLEALLSMALTSLEEGFSQMEIILAERPQVRGNQQFLAARRNTIDLVKNGAASVGVSPYRIPEGSA